MEIESEAFYMLMRVSGSLSVGPRVLFDRQAAKRERTSSLLLSIAVIFVNVCVALVVVHCGLAGRIEYRDSGASS